MMMMIIIRIKNIEHKHLSHLEQQTNILLSFRMFTSLEDSSVENNKLSFKQLDDDT